MTLSEFQKALLVNFAIREAGPRASVEMMKAICIVIRNRVRKGWHDGNWIAVIENAPDHAAHETEPIRIDPNSRIFQRLVADVDEIFYSTEESAPAGDMSLIASLTTKKKECLYWSFANRAVRPWFKENIQLDQENHPLRASMGIMMFYE